LGEFSALVANKTLTFEDALVLVSKRALAMQKACEMQASTMAAILGLDDATTEKICAEISAEGNIVVAANYNCPGQLVISGSIEGVNIACERLKAAGAKRALVLQVGGAFHSPLMQPAQKELEDAINNTKFSIPICPVYQNVNANSVTDPEEIKQNLILQLTAPVRWTQISENMIKDGCNSFVEVGPGKVLQGLVKKVKNDVEAVSA
jgi:[acyl-carrier-protein] S-malonyltransferase